MKWSERAAELRAIYAAQGVNEKYLTKGAEALARTDGSPVVYRTHLLYVREDMKS